ncbi:MAG: hypothetical protein CL694_07265 [Chloroflexi bacterium]|nr:hypothetical protein [Chloroflexota bacterium]HAL49616.1 hypothetical protein [Dehalococcoidia bacterium]
MTGARRRESLAASFDTRIRGPGGEKDRHGRADHDDDCELHGYAEYPQPCPSRRSLMLVIHDSAIQEKIFSFNSRVTLKLGTAHLFLQRSSSEMTLAN